MPSDATPTDLIHLCLTLPRAPREIRELAQQLQRGSRPGPKLSYEPELVEQVIALQQSGESVRGIAAQTGLSKTTVGRILTVSSQEFHRQ